MRFGAIVVLDTAARDNMLTGSSRGPPVLEKKNFSDPREYFTKNLLGATSTTLDTQKSTLQIWLGDREIAPFHLERDCDDVHVKYR